MPGAVAPADPAWQEHARVVRAREESVPAVMALTSGDGAHAAAAALERHFAIDGLTLLRKTLIARVERFLESPSGSKPPVAWLERVLAGWTDDRAGARAGLVERTGLAALWIALIGRAIAMPFARGFTRVERTFRLGVPNKWGPPRAGASHHDLLLVDGVSFAEADVVVLAESGAHVEAYRSLGVAVEEVTRAPVAARAWFGDVVPRVARLALRGLTARSAGAAGYAAWFAAWETAWKSLEWEAVATAVVPRLIVDVEEQNPAHAVKTAVFGRRGGRTLRLPHTQPDTPGNHTAFWMYDVVAVSSRYPAETYGGTWWKGGRIEPVGLMFVDDTALDAEADARAKALIAGAPSLVLFTGSHVGIQPIIHEALVRAAADALDRHPDLKVIIKPKQSHVAFFDAPPFDALVGRHRASGRLMVLDPARDEWTSAQALLRHASLCLTYGGSVVWEALALGTPLVLYPVAEGHDTPWLRAFRDSLVVADGAEAAARIDAILARRAVPVPESAVKTYCDPFCDGRGLERLTRLARAALETA